jgi:glutathione synthase
MSSTSSSTVPSWPPSFSPAALTNILTRTKDFQLTHGSLIKAAYTENTYTVQAYPIGISLCPTLWPRTKFDAAVELQRDFNQLYARISCDENWLYDVLRPLIACEGSLAAALWSIHLKVSAESYVQDISLGIFRSDYMLHDQTTDGDVLSNLEILTQTQIKQVEFNTFSCAGAIHSMQANTLHQHLNQTDTYTCSPLAPSSLESCKGNLSSLTNALASAHAIYGPPRSRIASNTAILITVQPNNINIADERPIEYALWSHDPYIPTYRVIFPDEIVAHTFLSSNRELLYRPSHFAPNTPPVEIAVVYHRAGIDENEYTHSGIAARYHLERSRAIQCPSLLGHLTTFKKVQQALSSPGVLERFMLSPKKTGDADKLRATFMPLFPLDKNSDQGKQGRALATNKMSAKHYVLKPSLEGGGHNIYGEAIPAFLKSIPEANWENYVLMRMIDSPPLQGLIATPKGLWNGSVISELGILGTCLWRNTKMNSKAESAEIMKECEVLGNNYAGFTFKTKPHHVQEMSVVKGYGSFDTPYLVDESSHFQF